LKNFGVSLGVAEDPQKLCGEYLRNCHNLRTRWPIKLIIHSNDAE